MDPGILFIPRIYLFIYGCYCYFHGGTGLYLCKTVALMSLSSFCRIFRQICSVCGIYWQIRTEVLGQKHVPLPVYRLQLQRGLLRDRTWPFAARDRRL